MYIYIPRQVEISNLRREHRQKDGVATHDLQEEDRQLDHEKIDLSKYLSGFCKLHVLYVQLGFK